MRSILLHFLSLAFLSRIK